MDTILQNENLKVTVASLGAEIIRLTNIKDGTEYIWSGDQNYWTGHSPVLFPIVGSVAGGKLRTEGTSFKIGNHGFARRSEFELVKSTTTAAIFRLTANDHTKTMYPYQFQLYLSYKLISNRVEITYQVVNTDNRDIYFQLGTHPAFNCPFDQESKFEDYYIEFEKEETLDRLFLNNANVFMEGKSERILTNSKILPLSYNLFYEGALVFKQIKSRKVFLKRKNTQKSITVSFENFPAMGIWQPKNAPFICIEPWHGYSDTDNFEGEMKDRELVISLGVKQNFHAALTIEIK